MKTIDWTKWAAIAEILSAIAIVMTLLYLALQTQYLRVQTEQTNQVIRSQTRSEIAQSITDMLLRASFSEYLPALMPDQNLDGLDPVDRIRFQNFQLANYRIWENIHYQFANETYELSEFEKEIEVWRTNLARPTVRATWCSNRHLFSNEFAMTMDSLLAEAC